MIKRLLVFIFLVSLYSQENIIAIRVDFQKDDSKFTTGDGKFNFHQPTVDSVQNISIDPPPHNRSYFEDHLLFAKHYIKKFFNKDLNYKVYPEAENEVYHLSQKMFHYNPNLKSDSLKGIVKLYTEAYRLAENAGITIQQDDIVIIFHAGTGNDIFLSIDYTPHDIPSIALKKDIIRKYDLSFYNSGKSLRGIILPETASQEGLELAMNGLVVANIATQLGFLDLVDPSKKKSVVGPWALEDRGLFNANGLLPSIPSAVNRFLLNLRPDKTDTVNAEKSEKTISVEAISESSDKEMIYIPINFNEFYLVENRQRPIYQNDIKLDLNDLRTKFTPANQKFLNFKQVLKHKKFKYTSNFYWSDRGVLINTDYFDAAIPHSGLLIWKMDQRQVNKFRKSNTLNKEEHYRSAQILEADGVDNLNTNITGNQKEKNDIFYKENKGKYYKNVISSNSLPHSKSFYENAKTGLHLSDFSSPSGKMTFKLRLDESRTRLKFPGKLYDLSLRSDSVITLSYLNNKIYRYAYNREMILRGIDSIQVDGLSYINDNGNHYIYAKNDSLFTLNFINTEFLAELGASLRHIKKRYLLTESGTLHYLNSANSIEQIDTDIDTLIDIGGLIISKNSGAQYHLLDKKNMTKLNISSENIFYNSDNESFYNLSFNKNVIRANNSNSVLAYEFPIKLYYAFKEQEIEELNQTDRYFISRDKLNIYKIFPKKGSTVSQQSIYTGKRIDKILFTEDLLIYKSGNSVFYESLANSLKSIKQTTGLFSGSGLDSRKTFLWPNPNLDGNEINIRIYAYKAITVKATIFQSNGRYIDSFDIAVPGNMEFDYKWNVSNIASGTYIILLKNDQFEKALKATVVH